MQTYTVAQSLQASHAFTSEVRRIKLLSRQEQQALVEQARAGDTAATDALIACCLPILYSKAHTFAHWHGLDALDLVQVACVRMLERFPSALVSTNPVGYLM